jgi:hypothetical protein
MVPRGFLLILLLALQGCALKQTPKLVESTAPEAAPQPFTLCQPAHDAGSDFQSQILPMLQSRCSPCHFPGGSMYSRLPFDRPATIQQLGTKLFTRIQSPQEQAIILRFLAQSEAAAIREDQLPVAKPEK